MLGCSDKRVPAKELTNLVTTLEAIPTPAPGPSPAAAPAVVPTLMPVPGMAPDPQDAPSQAPLPAPVGEALPPATTCMDPCGLQVSHFAVEPSLVTVTVLTWES